MARLSPIRRVLGHCVVLVALAAIVLTATPSRAQEAVSWADVENWTYSYASVYGADAADMLRIAWCEARGNPYAIGKQGEVGPYQFHPRGVWGSTPQARNGYSIYDVEANVAAAAWLYSRGYAYTTTGWYWCANYG